MKFPISLKAALLALFALLSTGGTTRANDLYWDADGSTTAGTGGTGTWTTANSWRDGSSTGTLVNWTDSNNAFFQGTAGAVSVAATAVTSGTTFFQVTGYTLQTDGTTTARTANGSIVLSSGVNLNLMDSAATANRTLNIGGSISGTTGSQLTIQGAQTSGNASRVNLSLANASVAVPITINGSGAGAIGIVATAVGTSISGNITNNSTARTIIGATSGNSVLVSGTIGGTAGLQFSAGGSGGAGVITLNAANNYGGTTTFNSANSGIIRLGVNNALSTSTDVTMGASASNGGILDLFGFNQTIASITSGSGGGSITNNAASGTSTLTINGSTSPATFGLLITNGTNGAKTALVRAGTGSTILSNTSSYSGGTTITGGTLSLSGVATLGATTGALTASGGTLNLGNTTQTQGAVTFSGGSITSGTLVGSSYDAQSGTVSASLAGSGVALTKSTAGTLVLSGSNTYSGATTVNGGNLAVNGSLGNTAVSVNGGTLSGTGTIGGLITVANGGNVNPGNSPGVLNAAGGFSLLSGGTLTIEMTLTGTVPGTNYDQVNVTGGVSLAGNLVLSLSSYTHVQNSLFFIVNNDLTDAVTGTFAGLAQDAIFSSGGNDFQISYTGDAGTGAFTAVNGNDVVLMAIPEPGTFALAGLGLAGVLWRLRRRS